MYVCFSYEPPVIERFVSIVFNILSVIWYHTHYTPDIEMYQYNMIIESSFIYIWKDKDEILYS